MDRKDAKMQVREREHSSLQTAATGKNNNNNKMASKFIVVL